jgi:hypothetical protein
MTMHYIDTILLIVYSSILARGILSQGTLLTMKGAAMAEPLYV